MKKIRGSQQERPELGRGCPLSRAQLDSLFPQWILSWACVSPSMLGGAEKVVALRMGGQKRTFPKFGLGPARDFKSHSRAAFSFPKGKETSEGGSKQPPQPRCLNLRFSRSLGLQELCIALLHVSPVFQKTRAGSLQQSSQGCVEGLPSFWHGPEKLIPQFLLPVDFSSLQVHSMKFNLF